MSDLRERLIQRAQRNIDDFPTTNSAKSIISDCWPIIETELQKRDQEIEHWHAECDKVGVPHDPEVLVRHHRGNAGLAAAANSIADKLELQNALNEANLEGLSWKASAEQNYTEWEEANKLLEQTIEVLEEFPSYAIGVTWWRMRGYPFLDNLKALKREPDAHQQAVAEILAPKPIDHVEGGFKP